VNAASREFELAQEELIGDTSSLYHLAMLRRANGDEQGAQELLARLRSAGAKEAAS
jgi:hypothetical protein